MNTHTITLSRTAPLTVAGWCSCGLTVVTHNEKLHRSASPEHRNRKEIVMNFIGAPVIVTMTRSFSLLVPATDARAVPDRGLHRSHRTVTSCSLTTADCGPHFRWATPADIDHSL